MGSEHLGQLILTGVPGKELDRKTAELFRKVQPGGFILFGRNIETAAQLRRLIDDLRAVSGTEPIVTIDQEGGRVSRLRLIGNEPPNAQQLREKNDIELIRRHGDITGRLLRQFGFNLDLCPVLDISFDDEADNSLRGRCYGTNVEQVVRNAVAFNEALRRQGVASCGKHFPGYSAATVDAHHDLPKIERSREQLAGEELAVFQAFSGGSRPDNSAGEDHAVEVDSMMICHAWYPCFDPQKTPASLSKRIVTDLLRNEMKFNGLIMTDDLDMGAIVNQYSLADTVRRGIAAGNDLLMICHRVEQIQAVYELVAELPHHSLEQPLASIARFKQNLRQPDEFSEERFREIDGEIWRLRVDVLGQEMAAQRSPEDGKRSPVEIY